MQSLLSLHAQRRGGGSQKQSNGQKRSSRLVETLDMQGGDLRRKERRKGQGHGHLSLCPRCADGSLASLLLWGASWVRGEPLDISCEERSILEDVMHGLSLARMPFSTTRRMGGRGRQASSREHWPRRSDPQLALCTISY